LPVRRRVEHLGELPELLGIQFEKYLIEQHRLRLVAGGFEHEVGAVLAEQLRRLVDQIPLFGTCPQVDCGIAHGILPGRIYNRYTDAMVAYSCCQHTTKPESDVQADAVVEADDAIGDVSGGLRRVGIIARPDTLPLEIQDEALPDDVVAAGKASPRRSLRDRAARSPHPHARQATSFVGRDAASCWRLPPGAP
jgi:hypothetical protein